MDKQKVDDRSGAIELSILGARCCIGVGQGVIRALGNPTHVTMKISDSHDSLRMFPCDEDDVMSFRVPVRLFCDHSCVMRINSKRFVHGLMRSNNMDVTRTYTLSGVYVPDKNVAVFSLVDGVTLQALKSV